VLIDRDRESQIAVERNLLATGFSDRAEFHRVALNGATEFFEEPWPGAPFDLVFCDPPYSMPDAEVAKVLDRLLAGWLLTDRALVVVERPAPAWEPPGGWSASWQRKYGDTLVTILHVSD
jgi:16S rRNA (guanine966-N2)-methyltransferase